MRQLILVFLVFTLVISCKKDRLSTQNSQVEKVQIIRFDRLFYKKTPIEIQQLKKEFPYLFPNQVPDSVWINKSKNEEQINLQKEVEKVFGNFKPEQQQLGMLFQTIKTEFPQFKSPKVITLISDIDYQSKVIFADSLLLISADMYLGKDHEIYKEFPKYLSHRYDKSMLLVDVAHAIAEQSFSQVGRNNFLNQMINQGKVMSLTKAFLPETPDSLQIGYTANQLQWAKDNESLVWQYFIENKLLYSYDIDLLHRFVFEAPFSKFYLDSDQESPGRIGVFMGSQIVESYLKNNEVTIAEMIKTEPDIIFEKSRYKPRK